MQVEKQRDKTQTHRHRERGMDAYVRLSRFPTEWELAGWCWLLGVNCDCDCAPTIRIQIQQEGAVPRPCVPVPPHRGRRLAQRAGHGAPACRDLGCLVEVAHSSTAGWPNQQGAHYSYTYSVYYYNGLD